MERARDNFSVGTVEKRQELKGEKRGRKNNF